jgi:hypothetical protein
MSVIVGRALPSAAFRRPLNRRSVSHYLRLDRFLCDEIIGELKKKRELTPAEELMVRVALLRSPSTMLTVIHYAEGKSESINRLLLNSGRGLRSPPHKYQLH